MKSYQESNLLIHLQSLKSLFTASANVNFSRPLLLLVFSILFTIPLLTGTSGGSAGYAQTALVGVGLASRRSVPPYPTLNT
jgi:hypothetical protein